MIRAGSCGPVTVHSSEGRPKMCFGMNQYPRRMLSSADSAACAASHAMSQPELPAPMIRTRLPRSSSMPRYVDEWRYSPANSPGMSGRFGVDSVPEAQMTSR